MESYSANANLQQEPIDRKYEVQILLEEYKACIARRDQQLIFQSAAINYGFLFAGGIATLMAAFQGKPDTIEIWKYNCIWILLVTSLVPAFLGLLFLNKDQVIIDNSLYIKNIIRPKLREICNQGQSDLSHILGVEEWLGIPRKSDSGSRFELELGRVLVNVPHLIFVVFGLATIVALYVIRHGTYIPHSPLKSYEIFLYFVANAVQLWFWDGIRLTSLRYRSLRESLSAEEWLKTSSHNPWRLIYAIMSKFNSFRDGRGKPLQSRREKILNVFGKFIMILSVYLFLWIQMR